jgi:hypothetical protein
MIKSNAFSNLTESVYPYRENDKIMLMDTGEVFTVHEDLSEFIEPGIIVKEKIGRLLHQCDVRAAGHTRERYESARGITAPDAPPPLPENCMRLAEPEKLVEELEMRIIPRADSKP